MSTTIKINTARLGSDGDKVSVLLTRMTKETQKLQRIISQLNAMWEGSGSKVFQTAIQGDVQTMESILTNLERVHAYETYARKEYESCERKVYAMVEKLKI